MRIVKLLIRVGPGRNKVIKRPGNPLKSDVPGGARGEGIGAEQFYWCIIDKTFLIKTA